MTTTVLTASPAAPAVRPELDDALHELAAAAALVADHGRGRDDLARVVSHLERLADAELDDHGADPLVVLQRRLGRAARLLLRSAADVDVEHLRSLCRALQPQRLDGTATARLGTARRAALAGC